MSCILAIGITYALTATEDPMIKGPRRAAQLCCTRSIFTAIAPRSVEKLLNTRRTLSLVAHSDGFSFLRECGFYSDCDDDFCIEILKKIVYLKRVYFSKGCRLTDRIGDYLLTVRSLDAASFYVEDELFPVTAAIKLLRDHRNESVRASIANTIVVHEQENRGLNTRTLIELRRLGADKILFDLIDRQTHQDVEVLSRYAGAIGSLLLSFAPALFQVQHLPRCVTSNSALMNQILAKREQWAIGLTPQYIIDNVLPAFKFLVNCRDSAGVRGSACLMLGSATARAEFENICEAVFTAEFFREDVIPILKRLTPLSPAETIARQYSTLGMRSFSEVREQVITRTTTMKMASAAQNSTIVGGEEGDGDGAENEKNNSMMTVTTSQCFVGGEASNTFEHHPHYQLEKNDNDNDNDRRSSHNDDDSRVTESFIALVPSYEEQEYSKHLLNQQQELSYFSWVLQNFANSQGSRNVLFSDEALHALNPFLKVYEKPEAATKKMKNIVENKNDNNIPNNNINKNKTLNDNANNQ